VIAPDPSLPSPPAEPPRPRRWWNNPLLLLLVLTPGIPEYLTGSSSATLLFVNPLVFAVLFLLNAGLYTAGALLIREAVVRWRKGWASVLLLGAAYGIVEEGLAVHTFFQASGNPVGVLGSYGRLFGVNWMWASGLTVFHAVYSIALPLLILGLVYPQTRGRPLVGRRGLSLAAVAYVADVVLLTAVVGSHPNGAQTVLFLGVVGLLVYLAFRVPAGFLGPRPGRSRSTPLRLGVLGGMWFLLWIVTGSIVPFTAIPPVADAAILAAGEIAILLAVMRGVGSEDAEWTALGFATGLIAVLVPWEILLVVASDPVALVLGGVAVAALWMLRKPVRDRTFGRAGPGRSPALGAARGFGMDLPNGVAFGQGPGGGPP
jgi:hypothetical protein